MGNTLVFIIILLCLEGVLSQNTTSQAAVGTSHASSELSSKSDASSPQLTSSVISSSKSDSSAIVTSTPPVSSSANTSASSIIQSSFVSVTASGSRSATPVLSSAMMTSTQAVPVHSSSVYSSAAPFVTPTFVTSKSDASSTQLRSSVISSSKSDSSTIVASTPTVSSSVNPSASSIIQSSFVSATASGSRSATPLLSSATMTSSKVVPVHSTVYSSAAPFVTPSPTAVITPESINFKDGNVSCLQARVEVDFTITYNYTFKQNNKTKENSTQITIPLNGYNKTRHVTGNCSYETGTAFFQIKWNERGNRSEPQHIFRMDFELNKTTHEWSVPQVMAVFQTSDTHAFKHRKPEKSQISAILNGTNSFGSRANGTNYVCDAGIKVDMSNEVEAMFMDVVLQPFSHKKKLIHGGDHCFADHKGDDNDDGDDNTVPIAVGAALGGLVLIVLVAYIVGRRRSSRGYEQV